MPKAARTGAALLALILLLSGCAMTPRLGPVSAENAIWRGRLSVRVDAEPVQSLVAGFELQGTETAGELTLYTPLGSTAAALAWNGASATLVSRGETKQFASLGSMIRQVAGTELPVGAVFSWLAGKPAQVAGWTADLSGHPNRISATRQSPLPATELRLVLDQP